MDPIDAMSTWVGALSRGGVLMNDLEEQGAELALAVLGEETLGELRQHFKHAAEEDVARERQGAIHACIWMANADREITQEEVERLEWMIGRSELPAPAQEALTSAIEEPMDPVDFADQLTEPGLRQLVLGLAIELAHADGRVDEREEQAYDELAEALGITEARAAEIREAVID